MSFEDLCGRRVYEVRCTGPRAGGDILGVVRSVHWDKTFDGNYVVMLLVQRPDDQTLFVVSHSSVVVGLP